MQSTLAPSSNASLTPKDRQLLAHAPYAQASIPETYRRQIVDYVRKEQPGTILVDTNARYLYYVLPGGKAIRYGVTVGEEALAWSGVARLAVRLNGRIGSRQRRSRLGLAPTLSGLREVRLIRWARGRSIFTRATRTPVPYPRHQPAGIYRPCHLVWLHPHDQRGRHRSRGSGEAGRVRRRPPAGPECMDRAYRWPLNFPTSRLRSPNRRDLQPINRPANGKSRRWVEIRTALTRYDNLAACHHDCSPQLSDFSAV